MTYWNSIIACCGFEHAVSNELSAENSLVHSLLNTLSNQKDGVMYLYVFLNRPIA